MSLKTFFAGIEADASTFFDKLPVEEQALLNDLKPILTGAVGTFLSTMLPVAEGIVLDLVTSGKTSTEKRDAAVSQLTSAAETAGLTVISGAANLVVEAAYSKLSASGALPAAATPASGSTGSAPSDPAPAANTASAPPSPGTPVETTSAPAPAASTVS